MVTAEDILKKYSKKIESEIGEPEIKAQSKDYLQFKTDMTQEVSSYERWVKSIGAPIEEKLKINLAEKDKIKIQKFIDNAHLDVTPTQTVFFSIAATMIVFFFTILVAIAIYLINDYILIPASLVAFVFLGVISSLFVFYYTYSMPQRLANAWKLKASSQMVPAILYVVIYMKHTSNLERAIEFAAQHLEGPLALDFKKIFYDVETSKYQTIKQSLDNYLETWNDYAPEFVESFHLIESSLYEPNENRRVLILEKALQVILDGIYEKMLKYSREIRNPLTNIYMLGIILPTLGLALIPLASTLLQGIIKSYHIFVLFNVIVPFMVFFMVSEVLLKRPGGYGESEMLELNPEYKNYKAKKHWTNAFLIALPIFLIGILPFLFQTGFFTNVLGFEQDYSFRQLGLPSDMKLFEFQRINATIEGKGISQQKTIGPFSPVSTMLSLCIPLSIAVFFSIAYKRKTKKLIVARENTKVLEEEFTNSLFQLGNRLGDGVPAEIAFAKVAQSTQGQMTNQFFVTINQNIQQRGMSLEKAIFDNKSGAAIYYPSALISTSMKILIESVKKGLQVAARSLMSISDYIKNIQKINQRLKDLLAEIVSDMKSNMTFLAPLLAGIVVGLATMIMTILIKIQSLQIMQTQDAELTGSMTNLAGITKLFNAAEMVPPYFLQMSIGLYIIEIIFILTIALVTVDAGKDTLKEKYEISRNLKKGFLLYLATAAVSIISLTLLASYAIQF